MHRTSRATPPSQGPSTAPAATVDRWRIAARLAYVAVVLVATLTKLRLDPAAAVDLGHAVQESLRPHLGPRDVVDGLRNLLLFAGWGLVWCLTARPRAAQRGPRGWQVVLAATVTGMLLSMFVETVQLFSPRRQASILDVITNTSGAFAGAVTTMALLHVTAVRRAARSYVGLPMFVLALAYGGAALLEIVLPGMRQDLLPGAGGPPLARYRLALDYMQWGATPLSTLLLPLLLMLPAGGFATAAQMEHGTRRRSAWLLTATIGVPLAFILECARGFTGQPIEPDMAMAHALGIAAGAHLTARFLPGLSKGLRGRERPLALLVFYLAVLALWRWRPFALDIDPDRIIGSFSRDHLFPLAALGIRVDMFSAAIVGVGFLLHVPVGALLAVWPLRQRGPLRDVLPGLYLVLVMEAAQLLIAERFFDSTDIVIGSAGVLSGWALLRRAGFRPHGEALPRGSG